MAITALSQYPVPKFDEFRSNLQEIIHELNVKIQELKEKQSAGDNYAATFLYLYEGLFAIIDGERKYRNGDYINAEGEYIEASKMISRFQRMNAGLPLLYQQEAERLDLFANGRRAECLALKKESSVDEQIAFFLEALNSYTSEIAIAEKQNRLLAVYNAKARSNFVQGLIKRLEGLRAVAGKDLYLAKKKHLDAYRYFAYATHYNPLYNLWLSEEDKAIKKIMNGIIREKAVNLWREAFSLSSEGKFLGCSEKCSLASKYYLKASKIATNKQESMLMRAYSLMLRASMFEAKANDFLKNKNETKQAIPLFELAAEAMTEAVAALPKIKENELLQQRWEAQLAYYQGSFQQTQGIYNLDNEKYKEAFAFFKQALNAFTAGLQKAQAANDNNLVQLLNKSIAEAKGYMNMCKTVLS